MTYSFFRW